MGRDWGDDSLDYEDELEQMTIIQNETEAKLQQAQAEVTALREYASHYADCGSKIWKGNNDCTCGLDKLLKEGD